MLTSMRCELNVYDLNCITAQPIHNMPNALYRNTAALASITVLVKETTTTTKATAAAALRQQQSAKRSW